MCGSWYKGITENSEPGYIAQEFDKLAPPPGFNWKGDPSDWLINASKKRWVVKTNFREAKVGAIVVKVYQGTQGKIGSLGIVREVTDRYVAIDYPVYDFDSGKYTGKSTREYYEEYDRYGGDYFQGYIWPEITLKSGQALK